MAWTTVAVRRLRMYESGRLISGWCGGNELSGVPKKKNGIMGTGAAAPMEPSLKVFQRNSTNLLLSKSLVCSI
jgi:hypothetical protein